MMRSPYFRQHYPETPGGKFEIKVEKNILKIKLFFKKLFKRKH